MAGHLPPSWRLTRRLFNVAIVVDVGGADGIDPRRNITVRTGGCGITDVIVPLHNITVQTGGCGIADVIVPHRNIAVWINCVE